MEDNSEKAKGKFWIRIRSILFLLPAWFSPHKSIRVFFHKLRGVNIGKNVEIGYFCIIGNVDPKKVTIKDNAVVTARVTILEHDNAYYYTGFGEVNHGEVIIGEGSFIGIGSVILPNISIGIKSIVAANSVVTKSVEDYTVNGGIPCHLIKKLE